MNANKPFQVVNSGLKFTKEEDVRTGIIIPDIHFAPLNDEQGGHDPKALTVVLKAIEIIKPSFVTFIGDIGEWSSVNHYEWAKKKRPLLRDTLTLLDTDAAAVNYYLEELNQYFKASKVRDVHVIEGNHELWLDNLCEEVPQLKGAYRPEKLMKLADRGWKYFPHGRWVKYGKLYLNHGTHAKGVNHPRSSLISAGGASIMYGHVHDCQSYAMRSIGGIHKAWSIGCLAKMDKPFLRGDLSNWQHAFAILHVHRSGNFTVEIVEIHDGVAWVYGKRLL
jgi:hypothetical protein